MQQKWAYDTFFAIAERLHLVKTDLMKCKNLSDRDISLLADKIDREDHYTCKAMNWFQGIGDICVWLDNRDCKYCFSPSPKTVGNRGDSQK